MAASEEWYERRLVEETGKLRVEVAGVEMRLVDRIATTEGTLRQEIAGVEMRLVDRMAATEGALRQDMAGMEVRLVREMGTLRAEMGTHKTDLLKWTIVLWVTQMVALAGILINQAT